MPQLIKYLTDNNDFTTIAEAVLKESVFSLGVDIIFLMQISSDGSNIAVIAQAQRDGASPIPEEYIERPIKDCPYLNNDVVCIDSASIMGKDDAGEVIFAPVFIRGVTAMYVGAYKSDGRISQQLVQSVSQITLIIQSIADNKNFQDSLASSYMVLEDVLDTIPIGVAVLDQNNKSILLMNRTAAESSSVQNAIGIGLSNYLKDGTEHIEGVYENETGLWYDILFCTIRWINDQQVLVCTTIDVTQKVKSQQRIEYQANNDYLTGLFNRMKCERDLKEIIDRAIDNDQRGVLLFLDLDDFKQVNDGLGHQYGDVLLQEIAAGMQSIPQITNDCYRMGGDEFVIIIKPDNMQYITEIVDSICDKFNRPWSLMEVEYYCTMSMGLAVYPDNGTTVHDIIKKADIAMYEAKKNGKNRYKWYEEPDKNKNRDREQLEVTIRDAVIDECREFVLYYQPVVDRDNVIRGAEALVRLNSSEHGAMMPVEFIPVAEYLGLISNIGSYVFEEACRTLKKWNDSYDSQLKMHINISAVQLMSGRSVDEFLDVIHTTGVNPENIVMDLSETTEFRDETKAFVTLDILRAYGIKVALDDFGTGSASLGMLKRLDTYIVKVDSSFVRNAGTDVYKDTVIRSICSMARDLDYMVCFEGVETEEQRKYAVDTGAALMEGFLFGKPVPDNEFADSWLIKK